MTEGLTIRGLTKAFGSRPVLQGLDLDLAPHQSLAILGATGSGKSTLLRCVAGLEQPDEGEIWHGRLCLHGTGTSLEPSQRALSMAFQQPCLWPHLRVIQNMAFGISHWPKSLRESRLRILLEAFHLVDLAQRYPASLSGGQARRVALARALAPGAPLLLLDEALVNLDPESRELTQTSLLNFQRQEGFMLLLVTHDPQEATLLCSRMCELQKGCWVESRLQRL